MSGSGMSYRKQSEHWQARGSAIKMVADIVQKEAVTAWRVVEASAAAGVWRALRPVLGSMLVNPDPF